MSKAIPLTAAARRHNYAKAAHGQTHRQYLTKRQVRRIVKKQHQADARAKGLHHKKEW